MHINCCIIGYRPFLRNVSANLASILDELIRKHGVDTFYVGESSALDPLFATAVRKKKKKLIKHYQFINILKKLQLQQSHWLRLLPKK